LNDSAGVRSDVLKAQAMGATTRMAAMVRIRIEMIARMGKRRSCAHRDDSSRPVEIDGVMSRHPLPSRHELDAGDDQQQCEKHKQTSPTA
jgi:hypothetical protein